MTSDHQIGEKTLHPVAHAHREWPYRRSAILRYGVAVLAVMAAFAIRYLVYGDLLHRVVFTFFVPAALVAAWYGGLGPGILATVLGLLLGDYFFMSPRQTLWPVGTRELIALGIYTATTAVCVILCESLHHRIRRFERALDRERHRHHLDSHPEAPVAPPHGGAITR